MNMKGTEQNRMKKGKMGVENDINIILKNKKYKFKKQ